MIPGVDTAELIRAVGYAGIFVIIFAETGLLIGFFLPGDSLLFTAGFLASQGVISVWVLIPVAFVAAVTGDAAGYAFGYRVGRALFRREESLLFRRSYLERTEAFFERHGGKVIVIARVMPIVRTFAPVVAGIGRMTYAALPRLQRHRRARSGPPASRSPATTSASPSPASTATCCRSSR